MPDSGFLVPFPLLAADGYLAILHAPVAIPPVSLNQVLNAFSNLPGPVAAGEIVVLAVPGFTPAQSADVGLNLLSPLTTNLQGAEVTFDGRAAYVMSVSPGTIECIVPVEIAGQHSTSVQVKINGALSNVLNVAVAPTALGLLSLNGSGGGRANARNSDGSLNGPDNPEPHGGTVTVFFTGAGVTSPAEADGVAPTISEIVPISPVSVFTGPQNAVHALPGFVPGIFACEVSGVNNPGSREISVLLSTSTSQSQALLVYFR